ncbi:hypothetical protein BGV21_18195 [Clostridioides difficile]|nr:hypothetical protein BGV21_18195 [Clostridioides difficile]
MEDEVRALECTLELNKQFTKPLMEYEVVKHTKSAETAYKGKKYKFKNSTLIDLLEITEEEQKYLRTIIGKKEANEREKEAKKLARRNENGLTKKQQELLDLKKELLKLKEKGLSNRSIAKQLNISESKVRTTLKK